MKVPAIALVVGALAYASVVTEAFLGYPLSPAFAYLSELSAIDQPSSPLVRSMDAIAGTLFAAVGLFLWRTPDGSRWLNATPTSRLPRFLPNVLRKLNGHALISSGLILAGVTTVLDAIFPMDCAESLATCRDQLAAGASLSHHAHTVTSSLAGLGLIMVAVGAFLTGSLIVRLVSSVVVIAMICQLAIIASQLPVGISQRVQVAASVILMLLLAWRIGGGNVGNSTGSSTHTA
ncbi:DUF998 domain-containing protein [Trueperella pyogenes]|uniref:DUF998 domain-containing protein n=1 Tax=Trueperella pyogenes TaxID=1661 RepID=UPI00117C2827|nr:DUF998 domain-containing protein [Trueperella pyogenes]